MPCLSGFICRPYLVVANSSEIRSKSTKTGKTRQIIVPPYCLKMLKKLKAEQAKLILKLGDAYKNDGWVFTQAERESANLLENILNKKGQHTA